MAVISDKDYGPGDQSMFPAEDLERLYRKGGLEIAAQIQGSSLNKILDVSTYEPNTMYIVTADGVKKL